VRRSQVRIGVVVGMAAEARIARRLAWPVAIGGGTAAGAEAAANALVKQGCIGLISFGLAGGLDPTLRPGALIVPSAVTAGGRCYTADPTLSHMLGGATPHLLLGADAIVASVEDKCRQREQTGAAAVDLESGAVARAACMHNIPFAVLRAICDAADSSLPHAARVALDAHGGIRAWHVLASIVARPTQLPALLALGADAAAARRSLIERVKRITQPPS
jgi:adenosylhomocysteine nucleosidase